VGNRIGPDAWWIPYYFAALTAEVCVIAWTVARLLTE
jgi:hypothetical protein